MSCIEQTGRGAAGIICVGPWTIRCRPPVLPPLVLKPNDYQVMHDELQIGTNLPAEGRRQAGGGNGAGLSMACRERPRRSDVNRLAANLDDAVAALKESWSKWLASAELSGTGEPSR